MGKCVVKECVSRSDIHNKERGITFHKVPKDPVRREKWVKNIQLLRKETDWFPTKTTLICSKHFRNQDKISPKSDSGHVSLSIAAVPMLEVSNLEEQIKLPLAENMDTDDNVKTDEEIDEITESPRKHKMRKLIKRLKFVSTERLKKIKNLSQKNRRLKTKNKKLNDIIAVLKKKRMLSEEEEMQLNLNDETFELMEEFKKTFKKNAL